MREVAEEPGSSETNASLLVSVQGEAPAYVVVVRECVRVRISKGMFPDSEDGCVCASSIQK